MESKETFPTSEDFFIMKYPIGSLYGRFTKYMYYKNPQQTKVNIPVPWVTCNAPWTTAKKFFAVQKFSAETGSSENDMILRSWKQTPEVSTILKKS